jgi:predicted transcriptional regulator
MADHEVRLKITLAPESSEKLRMIAARTGASEEAVASFLLARAIDQTEPDAREIIAALDQIPGAWERVRAGIADVRAGRTVPLEEL